ncbi:MAG: hypothetical protein Q8M03_09060 [Legionella sp.]|nr:hypothetical protein [Legionella sp.]
MTNILFCYWLQGYFEIAVHSPLNGFIVLSIERKIATIEEPLAPGIQWMQKICSYLRRMDFKQETLDYFKPLMEQYLNAMFYHYLENTLLKVYTLDELEQIHAGRQQ